MCLPNAVKSRTTVPVVICKTDILVCQKEEDMADLKIKVYKSGQEKADTVVTVPLTVVRIAKKFIPNKAKLEMEKEGIDLNEIADLVEKEDVKGTLIEVEKESERIVISVE
jgi:acyl CoA:acetate/3-ketoacid CoA transferase beta subunit